MSAARDIVIAGAGNLATALFDCMEGDPRWRPTAFIDEAKAGGRLFGLPIYHPRDEDALRAAPTFMAIGAPETRKAFSGRLAHLRLDWQTYVDRRSHVSRYCELGRGSVVMPFATIGPGASLGSFAYVGAYASIGGTAVIGEFASLLPRASAGGCTIGATCTIGVNSACLDGAVVGDAVVVAPYTWVRKAIPARSFVAGRSSRLATRRR